MPAYLSDNSVLTEFTYDKIEADSVLKENAKAFISSCQDDFPPMNLVYVGQREYATVKSEDPYIDIIGTDAATTCQIVLIVDGGTGNSSLCHFDGSDMENGIDSMIDSLKNLRPNGEIKAFDLYIVGGFNDPKEYSIKTTLSLTKYFIESPEKFNLKLCLVTKLNNVTKNNLNFPIALGLGYNLKNSKIFMCNRFIDKGPDMGVRGARHFSEENNLSVYDPVRFKLVIGPFDYEHMEYAKNYVQLPDALLLKYFSTSPEQEPSDFIQSLRNTFQAMIDHPSPLDTYFKQNKSHVYTKKENGKWAKELS